MATPNRQQRRHLDVATTGESRPHPWSALEYARWRNISQQAAAQERYRGEGPPYAKIGNRVYYDPLDCWDWLDANKIRHAGDRPGAA